MKNVRLTDEEEGFLEDNNLNFSEIVHNALATKNQDVKKTKKKNKLQFYTQQIIILGIGIIILSMAATPRNLMSWGVIFGLGLFFVVLALINLYTEWKH